MNPLEKKLIEYGFHEHEARLYLSAMELGPSPVQVIAKKAGINRVAAYPFIKSLSQKGLMSSYEEGKRTMYAAASPEQIIDFLDNKKREIDDQEKDFQKFLPQMKSMYNAMPDKPVVRYYEGYEGTIVMNKEMLEGEDTEIEMLYDSDQIEQYITKDLREKLRKMRKDRNIKTKVIYTKKDGIIPSTEDGERYKNDDPDLPFTSDITLYKNKVRFISFGKQISGIIIENEQITQTIRSLFKLALKALKDKKT